MNKYLKKLVAVLMAAVLISLIPLSASEAAAKIEYPSTLTVFLDYSSTYGFSINFPGKAQRVTGVKSSNKSVAVIDNLSKGSWTDYNGKTVYTYSINLRTKKTGTTNITYKIGSKTYKTKVKVAAYANPVKNASLFGIKNDDGKTELAGETADSTFVTLCPDSAPTDKKINITAANGYKITGVYVDEIDDSNNSWDYKEILSYNEWDKAKSKVSLSLNDNLKTDGSVFYNVSVQLWNSKKNINRSVVYKIYY